MPAVIVAGLYRRGAWAEGGFSMPFDFGLPMAGVLIILSDFTGDQGIAALP